jgi:hypothetical protein
MHLWLTEENCAFKHVLGGGGKVGLLLLPDQAAAQQLQAEQRARELQEAHVARMAAETALAQAQARHMSTDASASQQVPPSAPIINTPLALAGSQLLHTSLIYLHV